MKNSSSHLDVLNIFQAQIKQQLNSRTKDQISFLEKARILIFVTQKHIERTILISIGQQAMEHIIGPHLEQRSTKPKIDLGTDYSSCHVVMS